jgi:hypothetical protein
MLNPRLEVAQARHWRQRSTASPTLRTMKTLFLTLPLLLFVRLTLAQDFAGHTSDILQVKFASDATQANTVKKKLKAAAAYRLYSAVSPDGNKLVVSGYGGFTYHDLATGETRKIDEFSRTGSTIDLSLDGSLFVEGGSYGNAAIKFTETKTGKSWLLDARLSEQHIPPYQPSELQILLTKEREERRALLNKAKARRDNRRPATTKSKTMDLK